MLGNDHFYHQLTRKSVVLFGRMFDAIEIVRTNDQTGAEVGRFMVPIIYSPKEKMITRLFSDVDLQRELGSILPRMGFEITGYSYDNTKKQNSLLKASRSNPVTHVNACWMGVPYDVNFRLTIYTRNIDDGTHIVEQILPFFAPDYTVTAEMIPDLGLLKDVPIILNSVNNEVVYEGNYDSVRYVYWTLDFTMKIYYWGPVTHPKIIRTVYANIWEDKSLSRGYITRINTTNDSGVFKADDVVYQGKSYITADAYGIILHYDVGAHKLILGAAQGDFKVNGNLHCVSTNGTCLIHSFEEAPAKLVEIKIQPNPLDAEPTDDYGYTTTITEYPY